MLFLLFQLGRDRYALDVRQVAAVLPLVSLKQIPQAPAGIAGVLDYRGVPVPVIDLSELVLGRPARLRTGTRIVLTNYPVPGRPPRLLGLIAELATEILRREPGDFHHSGVTPEGATYLGPVLSEARGLVQWIHPANLLPAPVSAALFQAAAGEGD